MTLILVQYYLRYGPKQPHAPRQLGKKTEAQALQAVCEPSASTGEHAPGYNRNQLVGHNAYGSNPYRFRPGRTPRPWQR